MYDENDTVLFPIFYFGLAPSENTFFVIKRFVIKFFPEDPENISCGSSILTMEDISKIFCLQNP